MSEGPPNPDRIDSAAQVDPDQVAQSAALEDPQVAEGGPAVVPIEIQEDIAHDEPDQPGDDSTAVDPEIEARVQALRDRGRVGVLTEGTERPDTSKRMKNSDHDPDALAAANKANRLAQQQSADDRESSGLEPLPKTGQTFAYATESKLNDVAGQYARNGQDNTELKEYFEDPKGWEAKRRRELEDRGRSDEQVEEVIEGYKNSYDHEIERIGKRWDSVRGDLLRSDYERIEGRGKGQDQFRGDLLELYARDPEKYKAMSTEEFVNEGREFRDESRNTSRLASLETWGRSEEEKLPEAVEEVTSIADFCDEMNKTVNALYVRIRRQGIDGEEFFSFVESIEGKVIPGDDTLPKTSKTPEEKAAIKAHADGQRARRDSQERLDRAGSFGYFRAEDFASDLDKSPREQMKEALERVKVVTDRWIEAGEKARAEFDEKWGKAPEDEEPESKVA